MNKKELKDKFIIAYQKAGFYTSIDWAWLRGATKEQVIKETKELELEI